MARKASRSKDEYVAVIHKAALDVIEEVGPVGAKLAEIARRAGISYGMLYQYFPSRSELLLSVMLSQIGDVETQWNAAAAEPDPVERIIAITLAPIREVEQHVRARDMFVALRGAPQAAEAAEAAARRMSDLGLGLVRTAVREAQAQGSFAGLDLEVLATAIVGIPEAYTSERHAPSVSDWETVKREIAKLIERLANSSPTA